MGDMQALDGEDLMISLMGLVKRIAKYISHIAEPNACAH